MNGMPKALIIYGPPGSGKGTEAGLVARSLGYIHFDTGKYLRALLEGPEAERSAVLRREKKLNREGRLNTPLWVLSLAEKAATAIAKGGYGIVFSGSPRTMEEAFGGRKRKGLLERLSALYGKKNVVIIHLAVKDATSFKRNRARYSCAVCGIPRLASAKGSACGFCAGPFARRKDDDAKIIAVRLKEYHERTAPILKEARKRGYSVKRIDGEKKPFEVFKSLRRAATL